MTRPQHKPPERDMEQRLKTGPTAATVLVLFATCLISPNRLWAEQANPNKFEKTYIGLLELLHGKAVRVVPSPALCSGNAIPPEYRHNPGDWYRGKGTCTAVYKPNLASLISPTVLPWIRHFFDDPTSYSKMLGTLSTLAAMARTCPLTPNQKLELQSTAWELLFAIESYRPGKSAKEATQLNRLMVRAHNLLRATLLSGPEIRSLPDNLSALSHLGSEETTQMVQRLLAHDQNSIEVLNPTDLHIALSKGRFNTRVFLSVDEHEQERFREFLWSGSDVRLVGFPVPQKRNETLTPRYQELETLPHRFDGLHAVLVLYFNALNREFDIIPTSHVAIWQEYRIRGRIDPRGSVAENMSRVQFRTIEYVRRVGVGTGGSQHGFRLVPDNEVSAHNKLFNVNPLSDNASVTTHRGACLGCHLHTVQSFGRMLPDVVVLSRPLIKFPRDITNSFYLERVRPALLNWLTEFGQRRHKKDRGRRADHP